MTPRGKGADRNPRGAVSSPLAQIRRPESVREKAFLAPLTVYEENADLLRALGYPRVEKGLLIPAFWHERPGGTPEDVGPRGRTPFRGGAPGARSLSISDKSITGLRVRYRSGPYRWTARWTYRLQSSPPPPHAWDRLRRSMEGSLVRLGMALGYLKVLRLAPSHLLTLTIPRSAWESLPQEARPLAYRTARATFLHRFRQYLTRHGYRWAGLRWDEFQQSGVPHLHGYFDLGGRLPSEEWEQVARVWIPQAWREALRQAGFQVVDLPRTQFHNLHRTGTSYAAGYAISPAKAAQKRFPFPGAWGRTWDLLGEWREAVREARRADREAPTQVLDLHDLLVLREALQEVEAPPRLINAWLPLFQLAEAALGGDVVPGEVLRPYAGGFWTDKSRGLFKQAWHLTFPFHPP